MYQLVLLVWLVVYFASATKILNMNKQFVLKLGTKIKAIRESKKLTQDDIGINGVSRSMISLLELGLTDITSSKLKIIADNMGVAVKELFDFE